MKRQHPHNPFITLEKQRAKINTNKVHKKQKQKLLVEKYPSVNSKQLRWKTTLQRVCSVRLKTRNNNGEKPPINPPKGKKLKTE